MSDLRMLATAAIIAALLVGTNSVSIAHATTDEGGAFPSGRFIPEDGSGPSVEFTTDGTCYWSSGVYCHYGIGDGLYTEMSFEYPDFETDGPQTPATYRYDWDGERLTFELWGEDLRPGRERLYTGESYVRAAGSPAEMEFPTGTFVASEFSDYFVEYRDDGTCRWVSRKDPSIQDCTYATNGELYSVTTFDWQDTEEMVPATFLWDFDGELLTFEAWGEDPRRFRTLRYEDQPYRYVPDPRELVLAVFDIAAGTELRAGHTELRVVPGAESPADALTDRDGATGMVAAAEIAKGQPITPDLLEPPAE